MRAVTVQFDLASRAYEKLLDVLINSWKANALIPLEVHRIPPPALGDRSWSFYANTEKLKVWREQFTEDTIFLDADMLCLGQPSKAFDLIDDIGITDREGDAIPINGGAMYIKHTTRGIQFMDDFVEVNNRMLHDVEFHEYWQKKKGYAGMNQSAIGYLIENEYQDYTLLSDKWNCCDGWTNWKEAELIHVKGKLRQACLYNWTKARPPIMLIQKIWKKYAPKTA